MRILKYILSFGLILASWIIESGAQDPLYRVCAGDTGVVYSVRGWEQSSFDWTVQGGEITRNKGDTIVVNWGRIPGEYSLSVRETSIDGCTGELRHALVQVSGPEIDLGDDSYICEGEIFELRARGHFSSWNWHDGSTDEIFRSSEEGWIVLTASNDDGCELSDSLYLSVMPLPEVDLGPDLVICEAEGVLLDVESTGEYYTWSTGDIGPTLQLYYGSGPEIWVHVEDMYGCEGGDTLLIKRCDPGYYFRDIPNAFTPNDDDTNNVWEIDKLHPFPGATVEIYNQWGTLVWLSAPGYPDAWDGRDMQGRNVPVDSYHYVIRLNDGSGEMHIGYVTVIR